MAVARKFWRPSGVLEQTLERSVVMSWVLLIIAGLLEMGWAVGLKYTEGFTKPLPSVLTLAAILASMLLLSQVARSIPIGTAYAVWVGIGAFGAAVLGILLLGESASPSRLFFLALLLVAVVGLKFTSGPQKPAQETHEAPQTQSVEHDHAERSSDQNR